MQTTDTQRHTKKVSVYASAVSRIGFSKLEVKIGSQAVSKFELAQDALKRQQSPSIVADFLSSAQQYGDEFLGLGFDEVDVYDAMKSFK